MRVTNLHRRSVRLTALVACVVVGPALQAADDPPPRDETKPAGRIFVRALYMGDQPAGKPVGLMALDPDTGKSEITYPILTPGDPSPDGRFIAYSISGDQRPKDEVGVWVYDTRGEEPARRILDRPGEPTWTDQGKSVIVAINAKDDQWETWRVGRDGTNPVKLPIPDSLLVLDASPDDSWLAARDVGPRSGHWGRLSLVRPDGTAVHHFTEGSSRKDLFTIFQISPDGREIAYIEARTTDGVRSCRLFIADIEGKNRREVPVALKRGFTVIPAWSPDGSRLALNLIALQTSVVAVVDRDGKNFRQLPLPAWPWFVTLRGWSR